jgi:hypothetical protein
LQSSGIAAVIKAILMFQKNIMPPQVGMPHALNKEFPPLEDKKIRILSKAVPFHSAHGKPRRVLINNFDAAVSLLLLSLATDTAQNY